MSKMVLRNCHLLSLPSFLGRPVFQHTLYLGDDRIIAASSFFHTDLLAITGSRKSMKFMGKDPGDPEDPHDHIYLSETSRKYNKVSFMSKLILNIEGHFFLKDYLLNCQAGANDPSDINDSQAMDEDNLEIVADEPDRSSQAQSARRLRARDEDSPPNLLSLDAAILKSIDACPNEELKRKMYSCILLVGGGLKFKGADRYLQGKLATQVFDVEILLMANLFFLIRFIQSTKRCVNKFFFS